MAEGEGGKKSQNGGKGVKTEKPKKCFCCVKSSHNKSEYKNLSAAVKRKLAQRGRANRHASEKVDSESDERQWKRGDKHGKDCSETGCMFSSCR